MDYISEASKAIEHGQMPVPVAVKQNKFCWSIEEQMPVQGERGVWNEGMPDRKLHTIIEDYV